MKKYKITELGETSKYKKGQIITEEDFDISWIELGIKIGCMEEVKEEGKEEVKDEGKRWRADRDKSYYYLGEEGIINDRRDDYNFYDDFRYDIGNYFQTEELAQQKLDRDLAICRVNDKIRELQGGEMSMKELVDVSKYYIYYHSVNKEYWLDSWNFRVINSELLNIKDWEIGKQIIKECKDDLDIIWGINKK